MIAKLLPYLSVFFGSLVATLILTPIVRELNRKFGMVDKPDPRRINTVPIPRGGGLAIVLGLVLSYGGFLLATGRPVMFGVPDATSFKMIALSVAISLLGLADDKFSLSPKLKLFGQLVIAFLAWFWADLGFRDLWPELPRWLDCVLTVFWITGAVNAFKACEPKFIEVPTDNGGMIMEELEKILATTEKVKMIYVIPDFQNPTGRTWDLERRHKFMEIVNKYEIPVVEDNPYGELRFEGEFLPALKSLDTKGLVIYLGTFSKILAPGYRLGWVCADDAILAKYNFMKQAASLQASTIGQMETSKWIDMFDLDKHVATIRECYRKRRAVMLETLEKNLPDCCTFTRPEGGLFAWVVLPEYMDAKELQMKCLEKKVAFVPGGSFFPNGGHENTLRLNYSCMPEEKIVQGITALCATIKENLR